jgi:transcriptional regulator with XRE-family HTH domain
MAASTAVEQSFAERVKYLAEKFESVTAFSRKVGVSDSTVRKWIKGEAEPRRDHLVAIAISMGVRLDWLAMGVGPITGDGEATPAAGHLPVQSSILLDDLQLLQAVMVAVEREVLRQHKEVQIETKVKLVGMVYRLAKHEPMDHLAAIAAEYVAMLS